MQIPTIRRLLSRLKPQPQISGIEYWQARASNLGSKAVVDSRHDDSEIDAVTEMQKNEIFPHFTRMLRGDEKTLLDFGCGTGRFTNDLANLINGKAIGVDPIEALIKMAPRSADVEYRIMNEAQIPLTDASVQVVWVCLVMGGIESSVISGTVAQIERVLAPGGLLFVIENTSELPDNPHWKYRSIEEYRRMFAFSSPEHLHDYYDFNQRISILAGRKH